MMKKLFLISVIVFVSYSILPSQSLPGDLIENIKEATVYVKVKHRYPLSEEEVSSTGSGFFISRNGCVVTNYHVIQSVIPYYSISYPAPIVEIRIVSNSGTQDHKAYDAYIVSVDKENDLAVLGISNMVRTPFLYVDTLEELNESMPVWVFGYPFGETFAVIQRGPEITVSKGAVTALRHDDRNELTRIQIDAVVNRGNSGGPMINEKGKVIGIVNISGGATRMNFAVPSHFLNDLLKKNPLDTTGTDSTTISINSDPPGASVFVDWEYKGITPSENIRIKKGWHSLCVMKKGYEAWMQDRTINPELKLSAGQQIDVKLILVKELSIFTSQRAGKDIEQSSFMFKDNNLWKRVICNNSFELETILLKEDFNDRHRFEKWEQSTGGGDEHTWFMEEGALHQFESNSVLHAIFLGDSTLDNYLMQAKLRISNEEGDSRAGLIFRETDEGFYLFRIHKKSNKAQLAYHSKHPFGWFILKEKKLDTDITDNWYSMAVNASGNTISCFLDSTTVFFANAAYSNKGRIGFYSVESKASFDSLIVSHDTFMPLDSTRLPASELLSFWFTDYFNMESTWWYQYTADSELPSPWYFNESGCAQLADDDKTRYSEFTKYLLTNFSMNLVISPGEGYDSSSFDIFFRKDNNGCIALSFSKKDEEVRLLLKQGGIIKTLKKTSLPLTFFNKTLLLSLVVKDGSVICKSSSGTLIEYESKNLPVNEGRIGFAVTALRLVLHQMNVTSVSGDVAVGRKQKGGM
ncbi:MAG: trypsin-like peptidase domain-containing protein [Bacteroidota bacterium]